MPTTIAKLNCFFAGTFVYGAVFSYVLSWVLVGLLPRSIPEIFAVVIANYFPYVAAGALMLRKWKANTLFPEYVEREYATRYVTGQVLVFLCNAAIIAAVVVGWSIKTQSDAEGAVGLMVGMTLLLPGFLAGVVGLKMVSGSRSNTPLERTRAR